MKQILDKLAQWKQQERIRGSLKHLRVADVELLITAAQMKHLGKAAAFHHVSQSAASSAIQRVETAFAVPLCRHEKRQFRLTLEGTLLLPHLENWIKQLKSLVIAPDELPVRLVTTHAIAQIAVPALLPIEKIEFKHRRPDLAYAAVLRGEADLALVLDNAPWKGVVAAEVGRGYFQLYSRDPAAVARPVLLPEDQMEVLALQQSWQQVYGEPIPIKTRIPSWSLIANICASSHEVGFLPDFLAKKYALHPALWQPAPSAYRVLAIYRTSGQPLQARFDRLLNVLISVFRV